MWANWHLSLMKMLVRVKVKTLAVPSRSDGRSGQCVVKGRKKYSLERKVFAKWFSRWQMMQELAREWKEGEGQQRRRWPLPFWCATPVWPNDWPAPGAESELLLRGVQGLAE